MFARGVPLLLLLFVVPIQTCLAAAPDADREERTLLARRLVVHMQVVEDFFKLVSRFIEHERQRMPQVPATYWERLQGVVHVDDYRRAVVNSYVDSLNIEELRYLVGVMDRLPMKTLVPALTDQREHPDKLWLQKEFGDDVVNLGREMINSPAFKKMLANDGQSQALRVKLASEAIVAAGKELRETGRAVPKEGDPR